MEAERIVGTGPEYVYVYYFPRDGHGADWACKIGRAGKDWKGRIRSQQASMHEEPVVSVIRCEDCRKLEAQLHAYFRRVRLPTWGRGWFKTTPEAVLALWNVDLPTSALALGAQFKLARASAGWTQAELGARAGVRQATVSKLERDESVKLEAAKKVARRLGMKLILD